MADTFRHGIYLEELPTKLTPLVSVATPTVVIGTAPIHNASEAAPLNTPTLCQSINEFVKYFGWSDDFDRYTLCEAAFVHFQLFNVSPIIVINVFNPAEYTGTAQEKVVDANAAATLGMDVVASTVSVTGNGDVSNTWTKDIDYTLAQNDAGEWILTPTGTGKSSNGKITVTYSKVAETAVPASKIVGKIVGGVDGGTGKNTGLEAIEDVYPKLGLVPGTIIAPKYSSDSVVAAVMAAKAAEINGCFKAISAVDISSEQVKKLNDVNAAKNNSNFTSELQIVCWPKVSLGGVQYNLSTQVAALMNRVDSVNGDLPYASPSNKNLQMDSSVLADGKELYLSKANANYLNGIGVTTALNFSGGWRCWGVYTGAFPADTDPRNFIAVRRMMNWIGNTIIVNFWSKVDEPVTKRLVEGITDSINIWLNGLTARGALLGGRVEFLEADNPITSLAQGRITFHLFIMPPTPAVEINFRMELDTDYLNTLFS